MYQYQLFCSYIGRSDSASLAGGPPAVPPVADRPVPVAAGPPLIAHALPLRAVAAPVPRALRVQLRPLRDLVDLDGHRARRVGGHLGGGEEGEVSEFCLEEDGRRWVAAGGATEQGGVVGAAVVPIHGNLQAAARGERGSGKGEAMILRGNGVVVVRLRMNVVNGYIRTYVKL